MLAARSDVSWPGLSYGGATSTTSKPWKRMPASARMNAIASCGRSPATSGGLGVGTQRAEDDRVVAAEDDRQRARAEDLAQPGGDLPSGLLGVPRGDRQVAQVRDRAPREHVDLERAVPWPQQRRSGADR